MKRTIPLSILAILAACGEKPEPQKVTTDNTQTVSRKTPTTQEFTSLSFSPVVKKIAPAVVNIYSTTFVEPDPDKMSPYPFQALEDDPFFKDLHAKQGGGDTIAKERKSLGSGVLISPQGLILTNLHVIGPDAGDIKVVLSDKREYQAKVVLTDRRTDLAVIQIQGSTETFPHIPLLPQEDIQVGDVVLAIGNPFGVGQTVSSGIISALDRNQKGIGDFRSFIQTDAAINPGNSGGALITTDGRLVGINTAIYSQSGGSIGIGFAVPTSLATTVVQSAIEGKKIERPWLGVLVSPLVMEDATKLALEHPYGVIVNDLYPGGAAEKAGLKKGDAILKLNGKEIQDEGNFAFDIGVLPVGTTAVIDIMRGGKVETLELSLDSAPVGDMLDPIHVTADIPLSGAHLRALSPALALDVGVDPWSKGFVIEGFEKDAVAKDLKFAKGDVIRTVNGVDVSTPDDLEKVILSKGKDWNIQVLREGELMNVEIHGK